MRLYVLLYTYFIFNNFDRNSKYKLDNAMNANDVRP